MVQDAVSALNDFEVNGDSTRTKVFDKLRAAGDVCIENNDIHPDLKNKIVLTDQYDFKRAAFDLRNISTLSGGRNNNNGFHHHLSLMKSTLLNINDTTESTTNNSMTINNNVSNDKVFIVHGHDDQAKIETARFIEKAGLEAIILHEQPSGSKTIIEKIESYGDVGFAVILYTPCDIGHKDTDNPEPKKRARQNVVFEHGYFIGRLGRERVTALVKAELETPNDISGVVYTEIDTRGAWKMMLFNELENAGYKVSTLALK